MKRFLYGLTVISTLSISSFAWAGPVPVVGVIRFSGEAQTVPTLSGVMLVALTLLLGFTAYRWLKRSDHTAGRIMVITLMGLGALASGLGGVNLISNANAIPVVTEFSVSNGGAYDIYQYLNTYKNTGSGNLTVQSVSIDRGYFDISSNYEPFCTKGMILSPGKSCNVAVDGGA